MKTEQQDKLWNELSEEKKEKYRKDYKEAMEDCGESALIVRRELLAEIFGTHNLNPEPTPKTWEDVEKEYPDLAENLYKGIQRLAGVYVDCEISLLVKCNATLKIAKLIELSYGGMVSDEEWKDGEIKKYVIKWCAPNKYPYNDWEIHRKCFIAFHTPEQREEFMSHESNRQLVKQYFMM